MMMPQIPRRGSGDPRLAHQVRFADNDDFIPAPRRYYHGNPRRDSRRSTYDEVEVIPPRDRRRYDSGNEDSPQRRYCLVTEERRVEHRERQPRRDRTRPAVGTGEAVAHDRRRRYIDDERRPVIVERLTESPPPIDDESAQERLRTRIASSYETAEPRRSKRHRSRSQSRSRSRSASTESEAREREEDTRRDQHRETRRARVHSQSSSESWDDRRPYTRRKSSGDDSDSKTWLTISRPRYRSSSVASDDFDPYCRFNFVLPTRSATESSRDDESDPDTPEVEEKSALKEAPVAIASMPSKATLVHASQYTGNAELGGVHSASLTVLHDTKGRHKSLFKWLHVRQDVMNFDEFWTEVSRISGLSDLEKSALAKLRADVKKNCVKSRINPKGAKVGYLDPRSYEFPLKTLVKKASNVEPDIGSARWICIPYFSLEHYSGLLAATNLASFPAQTLLQMQYSRNTPQRDMEQAVCQLGTVNRGECFHISQLWCIVIDNSLLVTCGTVPQSSLYGEELKVHEEPSRDATAISSQGKILVSYSESVIWSFAVEECQTWFGFISKFQGFWPHTVEFWRKSQIITAETWPKMLQLASHPGANVKIKLQIASRPEPPSRAILRDDLETEAGITKGQQQQQSNKTNFHALILTPSDLRKKTKLTSITNVENLRAQLKAAERFLMQETSFSNRKAYKSSSESSREEVYDYLKSLAGKVDETGTDEIRRAYEERIDIFNAADIMHGLFLPKGFDDPTSRKFWGSLKELVTLPELEDFSTRSSLDSTVRDMRTSLRDFTQEVQAFLSVLSQASTEEVSKIPLPRDFVVAWLYLVMSMIFGAADDFVWQNRFVRASTLISQGMEKIMQGLSDVDLLERAAVMPLEVLSLITMGLLKDQVGKHDDICETYSQYLNSLETAITSKPSDRSYQHRIDLVQQEMIAIKRVLAKQRYIINAIKTSLIVTVTETTEFVIRSRDDDAPREESRHRPRQEKFNFSDYFQGAPKRRLKHHMASAAYEPTERVAYYEAAQRADDYMEFDDEFANNIATASKLSPTDTNGLRGLFFTECSQIVEQREYEFRRYSEYANDLERALVFKMGTTKDRQENAIFAFTLVTIIFLPLSAISSIFGMNTADVRDMEYSQWLYWATALPVTIVVIVAGLWGMGELGNIARWFMRKPSQSAGGYGTLVMPAFEQTYMTPEGMPPPPPRTQTMVPMEYSPPAYSPVYKTARGRGQGRPYRVV